VLRVSYLIDDYFKYALEKSKRLMAVMGMNSDVGHVLPNQGCSLEVVRSTIEKVIQGE
jgi:hypothetical protein